MMDVMLSNSSNPFINSVVCSPQAIETNEKLPIESHTEEILFETPVRLVKIYKYVINIH